ncbi:MAG TPA: universal stress protein [Candidatus Limnocylindria bacterium]|nr:universal stress protein [Candidatus Limnocylindria bacterium]
MAMYAKILIPLDGSTTAEKVLPFARILAGTLKLPVELLEIVDIAAATAHMVADKARYLDTIITEAESARREYLAEIAETFAGVPVTCKVARGRPADVIIESAAADKGTLIAMATHGRSGINRWLMGSVAEKVLRGSTAPLFLVRAARDGASQDRGASIKSMIVPLDGSELAESVLPTVCELAIKLDLEVVLFRAYELAAAAYYGNEAYLPNYDEMLRELKMEVEGHLQKTAEGLTASGLTKVSWVASPGSDAEEIVRFANQHQDALVAMCTHGRSGVARWTLGSVTEKVVRHAEEPVLVVHAP